MSGRRRLWRVTVVTTHEAVAFTETEQEAREQVDQILHHEDFPERTVDVEPLTGRPAGWGDRCIVYGPTDDVWLEDAERMADRGGR